MLRSLKRSVRDCIKGTVKLLPAAKRNAIFQDLHKQVREAATTRLLTERSTVRSGLFAGMKIPPVFIGQSSFQFQLGMLVGTYEQAVHELIKEHAAACEVFIDIGCGCGYYTVGVARFLGKPSIGYDLDPEQIKLAQALAAHNDVDRITVHRSVTVDALPEIPEGALVLVDIDGAEISLFERLRKQGTPRASFIVECHVIDGRQPREVAELLAQRLEKTHRGRLISESHWVDLEEAERTSGLSRTEFMLLAREQRSSFTYWLCLVPQ